MLGFGMGSWLGFYFAEVLYNFSELYAFHSAQMQNGYGVRITVMVSGYMELYVHTGTHVRTHTGTHV